MIKHTAHVYSTLYQIRLQQQASHKERILLNNHNKLATLKHLVVDDLEGKSKGNGLDFKITGILNKKFQTSGVQL